MKYYGIILFVLLTGFISFSQPTTDVTQEVARAVREGNAEQLASFFGQTIDITLTSSEGTYSKAQATLIMKDFFDQYPPSAFEVKHEGSSDNGSLYMIGDYSSGKVTFRVYILLKLVNAVYVIQQIQFEEE